MIEKVAQSENYFDALKAKVEIDAWRIPGVRHQGLSKQDFSALIGGNFILAPTNKGTIEVAQQDEINYKTYSFDSNGRLVECRIEGEDFPITYKLEYDELGRLTQYDYSGNGECEPSNERLEIFEYPEGRPDDHYTRIIKSGFYNQSGKETWKVRQASQSSQVHILPG